MYSFFIVSNRGLKKKVKNDRMKEKIVSSYVLFEW